MYKCDVFALGTVYGYMHMNIVVIHMPCFEARKEIQSYFFMTRDFKFCGKVSLKMLERYAVGITFLTFFNEGAYLT